MNFDINPATEALMERLRAVPVDGEIPYSELSQVAGVDVQDREGRSYLRSARRRLERDEQISFITKVDEGLWRAPDKALLADSERRIRFVRRAARRQETTLGCIEYDKLPTEDDRALWRTRAAQVRILGMVATERTKERILPAVVNSDAPRLSARKTLEALLGRTNGSPEKTPQGDSGE